MIIGCVAETRPGENRVGLVPEAVPRLLTTGLDVLVETGAGARARFPDDAYQDAGATLGSREQVLAKAELIVSVDLMPAADTARLRPGQALLGLFDFGGRPDRLADLTEAKVTVISLAGLPRTLSRAQSMDALTSQANVAGYKAALVAAANYPGYFPMLMTAAGTIRPASVLVIGAGVAGLQAISTARRLGAMVTGYDVREDARADISSTGASVLDLPKLAGTGKGGYARELTTGEQDAESRALAAALARFDVVITTAAVPGAAPPLLVTAAALDQLRSGSVVVDLAAGDLGGNVEGSVPGRTVITGNGVTVIGAGDLAATVPTAASTAYARNVVALLGHLVRDGMLVLEPPDEITAGVLLSHDGATQL